MGKIKTEDLSFIKHQRVGRLATLSPEKNAHVVPLCYVVEGDNLYISTNTTSKKIRNIEKNAEATFLIDEYSEDWPRLKGVMISGRVKLHQKGGIFTKARDLLYAKYPQYQPSYPIKEGASTILQLTAETVTRWDFSK